MSKVSLKHLQAFAAVADQASFRRAAVRLNTTQPNISARIAALEGVLGAPLMTRDAGSVRLTPLGRALLPKARGVLASLDAFLVAAEDRRLFDGVLRLGVTEMIVHSWLGSYLTALKERFPKVDVDLMVDVSSNLSDALFSRAIDLSLQNGPFARQVSGLVELGSFPMVWVAAPGLVDAGSVLSLGDLTRHSVLTHARGTLPFEQLRDHLSAMGVQARLVPSTHFSACLEMTRQGLGVACLPKAMVLPEIGSGRLVALRYLWVPDALRFSARYAADTAPHFVAQAAALAGEISLAHDGRE